MSRYYELELSTTVLRTCILKRISILHKRTYEACALQRTNTCPKTAEFCPRGVISRATKGGH